MLENLKKIIFVFLFFCLFAFSRKILAVEQNIDLLWESSVYTPYYYKGKGLITPSSFVQITAMANFFGKEITNENNLEFDWFFNNEWAKEVSGVGKNTFIFKSPSGNGESSVIKVEVSNSNKTLKKTTSITLTNHEPEVLIYEYNPLLKEIYQKAVSSVQIPSGETTQFKAEPYFIPKEAMKKTSYLWTMNGNILKPDDPFNILIFESEKGSFGSAYVNVSVEFNDLIKSVKKYLTINVI